MTRFYEYFTASCVGTFTQSVVCVGNIMAIEWLRDNGRRLWWHSDGDGVNDDKGTEQFIDYTRERGIRAYLSVGRSLWLNRSGAITTELTHKSDKY
jgi:hypothetical protein